MAIVIAGLLITGIVVAGVRGARENRPAAAPTTESPSPEPTVTVTFTGLPPFVTPSESPSAEPTETETTEAPSPTSLAHTGAPDGSLPAVALTLLVATIGAAALLRADP
jgi:hypothetical protein